LDDNLRNIPQIDKNEIHFLSYCLNLSQLDGKDIYKHLEQIYKIDRFATKNFFVYIEMYKYNQVAIDEFILSLGNLLDESLSNDDLRCCVMESRNDYFHNKPKYGFVCSAVIAKKLSANLLKYWCGKEKEYHTYQSENMKDNVLNSITELNYEVVLKLMDFIYSEGYLLGFKKDLFFDTQNANPQYYQDKLLISFFEDSLEQRKNSWEVYHNRWLSYYDKYSCTRNVPIILAGAIALALDIRDVRQLCSLGSSKDLPANFYFNEEILTDNNFCLCLLSRVIDEESDKSKYRDSDRHVITALIQRFNEICAKDPESLILALPWLIAIGKKSIDSLVICNAVNNIKIQNKLDQLTKDSIPILATRAKNILLTANGTDNARAYEVISWWNDKLRGWKPDILDAPRSTWMGNANAENMLRDIGRKAADNLLDIESLSEEGLTGALLQSLVLESKIFQSGMPNHSILSLEYKKPNLPQEKKCGADLIIKVQINYNGMETTRLHFVQIKRINGSSDGYPKWTINLPQLQDILMSESSATYWLFSDLPSAKVLCTPVGVIRACTSSRSSQGTATISHSDVRNASIDLGNLLCDLVAGLWLGIEPDNYTDEFIEENYKPKNILTIKISEMDNR